MTETAVPAKARLRDHLSLVLTGVSLVAVALTFAVAIPRIDANATDIRESASAIDAVLVSSSLDLARMESGALPTTVTSDDDGTLRFDGEPVLDVDGEPITLLDDKAVTGYEVTGSGYRFCVVDEHGPWTLTDTSHEDTFVSGADDQACTMTTPAA